MRNIIIGYMITASLSWATASPLPDYPLVFARGEVQSNMPPDICTVRYQVKIRDTDSTNALSMVEARSAHTLAILATNGVSRSDIMGYEIDKDVVRDYEKRDQLAFLGYEISRQIRFTLRDLSKYESIVSALLKTPDVVGIRTVFDRTDRKEVEARLLADAVLDAQAKATLMADGSGQRIVTLRAISQHGFYNLAEEFGLGIQEIDSRMYSMESPPEKELLFVPSVIEFGNRVSVIYEIGAK